MNYIFAFLVISVLITVYIFGYLLNNNISKPENCKEIECQGCRLNCDKRSE